MPVLEGAGIYHVVYAVEDFVPLALVLVHRHGIGLGQLAAACHDGLLAVNPRRDERGQSAGNVLALLAHGMEGIDGPLGGTAYLAADVPSAEALVLAAILLPHFVYYIFIVLNLPGEVARVPVAARIVEAEVELHAMLVCQAEEHVQQVGARLIASLAHQVFGRIGDELAVAGTDHDDGVDADGTHVAEVPVPLFLAPVLVGDVMGNLIQEGAADAECVACCRCGGNPFLPGNEE